MGGLARVDSQTAAASQQVTSIHLFVRFLSMGFICLPVSMRCNVVNRLVLRWISVCTLQKRTKITLLFYGGDCLFFRGASVKVKTWFSGCIAYFCT